MVTPDQKTLVINSRYNSAVYLYSLPDVKPIGVVNLSGKGAGWLTITPDSKRAYVANEHTNNVSVIDIATQKEVAVIPVGFAPARNVVWMAP
jgi:YVTN family beta-propeller protein